MKSCIILVLLNGCILSTLNKDAPPSDGGDGDGDGQSAVEADGSDCDDLDPTVYAGAPEICDDGKVNDCVAEPCEAAIACWEETTSENADASVIVPPNGSGQEHLRIASAGDLTGDGHRDILIGSPFHDEDGNANVGAAFLVEGPLSGQIDPATDANRLVGADANVRLGSAIATVGDVNGDGHDDVLVGALNDSSAGEDAGAVHVLCRGADWTGASPGTGVKLLGEAPEDTFGHALAGLGDGNADGLNDFAIGAWYHDGASIDNSGAVYLIHGRTGWGEAVHQQVYPIEAVADAKVYGKSTGDGFGFSMTNAGDTDGDGVDELLVGAPFEDGDARPDAGGAYLVPSDLTGVHVASDGFVRLTGENQDENAGFAVAGPGDVNADGYDDLFIGADSAGPAGEGAAYLLFGPTQGRTGLKDAATTFIGEHPDSRAGFALSGAGDVDGDGLLDLLVGAKWVDYRTTGVGRTYLILCPSTGTVYLSDVTSTITGVKGGEELGASVAGAGDLNNDGLDDLLIAAWGDTDGYNATGGVVHVFHGRSF
ncbi:MAG: FG-GAP repeat protein [Alphaproteobacteria bacterium]|nr:FG-GAP repeat protein [Alphaproteobacteria bacterium]